MKAVILAAGKGTRMGGLTHSVPKPMLCVHGKPILQHIIEGLAGAGINKVCVITGYYAETIEGFFQTGEKLGVNMSYVRQQVQDGTGKAPELARDFANLDPFLLTYGDILVLPQTYKNMVGRFQEGTFSGVVAVIAGEDVTKGGLNLFDDQFCLRQIVEKPTVAQIQEFRNKGLLKPDQPLWYNAGLYIFRPSLFQFTNQLQKSSRGEYELPDAINAMTQAGHQFAGLKISGLWVDVRDPEVLATLDS